MTKRLLLVPTCGTSFLTNCASADDHAWAMRIANDVEVDTKGSNGN